MSAPLRACPEHGVLEGARVARAAGRDVDDLRAVVHGVADAPDHRLVGAGALVVGDLDRDDLAAGRPRRARRRRCRGRWPARRRCPRRGCRARDSPWSEASPSPRSVLRGATSGLAGPAPLLVGRVDAAVEDRDARARPDGGEVGAPGGPARAGPTASAGVKRGSVKAGAGAERAPAAAGRSSVVRASDHSALVTLARASARSRAVAGSSRVRRPDARLGEHRGATSPRPGEPALGLARARGCRAKVTSSVGWPARACGERRLCPAPAGRVGGLGRARGGRASPRRRRAARRRRRPRQGAATHAGS